MSPSVPLGSTRANRWWNQILPYTRTQGALLVCPSDTGRKPASLENGQGDRPLVPRSYVANRAVEGLSLAAVETPADVIIVTEKDATASDAWFEPPKDLYPDPGTGRPIVAALRHSGGLNAILLDGHAKWLVYGALLRDPCGEPYSGVQLMRRYPLPGVAPGAPPWHSACPG